MVVSKQVRRQMNQTGYIPIWGYLRDLYLGIAPAVLSVYVNDDQCSAIFRGSRGRMMGTHRRWTYMTTNRNTFFTLLTTCCKNMHPRASIDQLEYAVAAMEFLNGLCWK